MIRILHKDGTGVDPNDLAYWLGRLYYEDYKGRFHAKG